MQPLDDFELVLYSTGSKGTGYPICPACYNNPPFENFKKGTKKKMLILIKFVLMM
jgi:hypothetical protein